MRDDSAPGEETHSDAIVLGAGISGLVSASILSRTGARRILVIDEYDHIGGNHIERSVGPYTFDIGSLIFQDDAPLLRHFPELLPYYVPISLGFARLTPQGRISKYPISVRDDLIGAGPLEWARIGGSVFVSRLFRRAQRNANEYAQYWIGRRFLHRSGLYGYMERLFGRRPEEIDVDFAKARMFWIRQRAELRDYVRRWLKPQPWEAIKNQQLARPVEGFDWLYRKAAAGLEARGVAFKLGARLQGLSKAGQVFRLETADGAYSAPRVISTIPLNHAQRLCGFEAREALPTVTLISLFFSFSGDRGFAEPVLYNFSNTGAWKRLTVYSDFYGVRDGRMFFTAEVNADHVDGSVAQAEADFRGHVAANGLFKGDLRLEGRHVLDQAYPIYAPGASDRAKADIGMLREFGVESLGRQGRFDYQPTARVSTVDAEAKLGFHW